MMKFTLYGAIGVHHSKYTALSFIYSQSHTEPQVLKQALGNNFEAKTVEHFLHTLGEHGLVPSFRRRRTCRANVTCAKEHVPTA